MKAENWIATGSRPVVEDEQELKHPVSEKKDTPDVIRCFPNIQSEYIQSDVFRCFSAVPDIDCEGRCQRSPIEINSCPLLNKETPVHCEVQHQHNIPSVEPSISHILDPAKFNGSSGSSEKGAD